jgi:hypothetical protein
MRARMHRAPVPGLVGRRAILVLALLVLIGRNGLAGEDDPVGPSADAARRASAASAAVSYPVFGFSVIGSSYRLEPWKNLLTEGGDRAVELGTNTEFIYLRHFPWNAGEWPAYLDGTDPGEAWPDMTPNTLAQRARMPLFDRFLSRPELPVIVMTTEAAGTDSACPTGDQQCQYFELTKYLMQRFNGTGKTFVLKNWEGDWLLLGSYCKPELGSQDPCLLHADVTRAKNTILSYRAQRDGVIAARQLLAGQSDVNVYFAVEVNLVQQSLGGRLRLSNLLPYIGPDVGTYSAWDSVFAVTPFDASYLTNALRFLADQNAQLAKTREIGFESTFSAFPVQPADRLGLGNRRLVVTEYSSRELQQLSAAAGRIQGVIGVARQVGILGAYFWELYDNSEDCRSGAVACGGGDWIYRPDGTRSVALDLLKQSAGWTPRVVPAPVNLHAVPAVPVLGSSGNNLLWDRVAGGLSYLLTIYPPNNGAPFSVNTVTRNWYTLGASLAAGTYRWTLQARGATDSPVVQGPDFTITCQTPIAAGPALPAGDVVWVEDQVPAGAVAAGIWTWDTAQKASGSQSHTEPSSAGMHQHYFYSAPQPLVVAAGDKVFCYVLLDSCDPPQEVMLQWLDPVGGWEHRAYWGADAIPWGAPGTVAHAPRGALPAVGQWMRLEVPAEAVGLVGASVNGMAFTLSGGHAWFDRAGVVKAPVDAAQFISQTPPPSCMWPGSTASVSVTMRNTGNTTWDSTYRLGSQNPQDNGTWGFGRVFLAPGETIAPGLSKTFTFTVTMPSAAGVYNFQWRMVHEGVQWFGALTPNTTSTNAPPAPPTGLSPSGTTFPAGTTSVSLSWNTTTFATKWAVRVQDNTDGTLRDSRNNCAGVYLCVNDITSTSYSVPVISGHSYTWWVHAGDCVAYSTPTANTFFWVAAPAPPPPPTGLSPNGVALAAGSTSVTMTWNATPGADRYAVRLQDNTDGSLRSIWSCPGPATLYLCVNDITPNSYTSTVVPGHSYSWWVHAGNVYGYSVQTNASFSVPVAPLHAPTGLYKDAATPNLIWTPPDNLTAADQVTYDLWIYGGPNCASGCFFRPGAPSWYTMGPSISTGSYTWTLKANSASRASSPAVSGPPFTMP